MPPSPFFLDVSDADNAMCVLLVRVCNPQPWLGWMNKGLVARLRDGRTRRSCRKHKHKVGEQVRQGERD
jgi:hypothetical protein